MRVQILDTAEEDLVEGYWFYESQQPGLGAYFRDSICADLEALEQTAGVHRIVYKNYHRALATRFPFAFYYSVSEQTALCVRSSTAAVTQPGSENTWNRLCFGWQVASRVRQAARLPN